jgi:translation initiation factor eIF-2B subunit epsilon
MSGASKQLTDNRPHPESAMMLVHPPSSRLLHYSAYPLAPAQSHFDIPSTLFSDPFPVNIDTYEVWGPSSSQSKVPGYRDVGIDICEADVPALCTENFDYHDLRRHFINGVLTSELLGKKIAVHLFGEDENDSMSAGKYVERIRDTRTFGEVTGDVLRRWAFPLVPDLNEPGGTQYELRRGNVYVAKDEVKLSR